MVDELPDPFEGGELGVLLSPTLLSADPETSRAVPILRWFEQESERLRKPPSPRSFRILATLFDDDLQVAIAQAGFSKQSGPSVDSLARFLIGLIRFRASLQAELIGSHAEGGYRRKGEKRNDERSVPGRHGRDALVERVRSHLPR